MNNTAKRVLPITVACATFFIVTSLIYFPGLYSKKVLNQHDILQWRGGAQESIEFRKENGDEALWTNSMFSGMPAYLVSTQYWGDVLKHAQTVISLGIPRPYSLVFLCMVSFFVLLKTFRVNSFVALIGAISYGATTHVTIGVLAGHTSRIAAIAFLPLVVAGVKLVFDKKYRLGAFLTAFGLALEIRVEHLQITYYLLLLLVIYGISELIFKVRHEQYSNLKIQIPVLLLSVFLAVGATLGKLVSTASYSKHTIRGVSELDENKSGLDKSYAFEFSNDITEPIVLFIPNFYGGASNQELSEKSNLAKALKRQGLSRNQIKQRIKSAPTYWGKQRLSAPYYLGASILFLAILGSFLIEKKHLTWIWIVIGLGIILSWGDNFKTLNYFFFDHLPGYNKFRSVTFTLILSIFGLSLLASLGLNKLLIERKLPSKKHFLISFGLTGGFALAILVFAGMGSFRGAVDNQLITQQVPDWYIDALRADREKLLRLDSFRSFFFVISTATLLWLFMKNKLSFRPVIAGCVVLLMIDIVLVNKRYVKEESFQENIEENYFKSTEADKSILSTNNKGARVLNLLNPFNESKTSYLHSSIGGYHGAKLGRYQELIESGISKDINDLVSDLQEGRRRFESYHILNMLNTGYFKFGDNQNSVIPNPAANGNAWIIEKITKVSSSIEELSALNEINTKTTAVVDTSKFSSDFGIEDSDGSIELISKTPRKLTYNTKVSGKSLAVFSEIFYPEGWRALIDGKESEILRVNYVLRALSIEPGEHEIVFEFEPKSFYMNNVIMFVCGIIIIVGFLTTLILAFSKRNAA